MLPVKSAEKSAGIFLRAKSATWKWGWRKREGSGDFFAESFNRHLPIKVQQSPPEDLLEKKIVERGPAAMNSCELSLRLLDGPARDLIVAGEPNIWIPAHILQQLMQHRRHERSAAEMRMHSKIDQ